MMNWETKLSQRVWDVRGGRQDSPFIRLLEISKDVPNLISLGRGDPDLPTPPHIISAAKQALDQGKTKYTVPAGLIELRQAIAEKNLRQYGLTYNPDKEIIVTSGTQEAVNIIFKALLDKGDEVIIPDPYYMAYWQAIQSVGGVPVTLRTRLEENFVPQPKDIATAITPRTKAIILVSPSNPTGSIININIVREICRLAKENDLVVISDELYEFIVFDGVHVTNIASLPGMWERTITVNGPSKTYSMTGFRVGYFCAPEIFAQAALEIRHMLSICASTVSQWAALAALTGPQDCIQEFVEIYQQRRSLLLEKLKASGIPSNKPSGAFFAFADIRSTGLTSFDFCVQLLRENGVLVFPGTQYGKGGEGFVRISFLAPMNQLEDAMDRMKDFYHKHTKI
jgi:aminotransferase